MGRSGGEAAGGDVEGGEADGGEEGGAGSWAGGDGGLEVLVGFRGWGWGGTYKFDAICEYLFWEVWHFVDSCFLWLLSVVSSCDG